jgi:hypothetical protein
MLLNKSIRKFASFAAIFSVIGVSQTLSAAPSSGASLSVAGPVEALHCSARRIQVLGIAFSTTNSPAFAALCASTNHNVYKYVAIAGIQSSKGLVVATSLKVVTQVDYAPGATFVYLKGTVTNAAPTSAEFSILGARVLTLTGTIPNASDLVEIIGTQPSLGGTIVAAAVGFGTLTNPDDEFDSLARGIVGSGVASSGIVGSGMLSLGIVGSGVASSGIVGSGISASGIVGSGVSVSGIVGSGAASSTFTGSEASTSGIVGSGVAKGSRNSSDVARNGIVGSG